MEGQKLRKDKYLRCLCSINTVYEDDIGRTNLIEHHIDTKEVNPIKQPPRKVPLAFAEAEKECITQLEKQRVIQKSTSPWASLIVSVRKKNGKVCPCVDYRRFNAITEPDAFPLPIIQDCFDSVAGSAIFSTFEPFPDTIKFP